MPPITLDTIRPHHIRELRVRALARGDRSTAEACGRALAGSRTATERCVRELELEHRAEEPAR